MTLASVSIAGYRSIRKLDFPLRRLTVLVGANGVGKTNLYRALELLQASALGVLADEIAREGGLGSVFWAGGRNLSPDGAFDPQFRSDGPRKGEARRLVLEARLEGLGGAGDFSPDYRIELGFPPLVTAAAFPLEAQVKAETLVLKRGAGKTVLMERKGNAVWARGPEGRLQQADDELLASETALSSLRAASPEVDAVRTALANWRFFHGFRTDQGSPLRRPCRAVTSPLLNADGSNLAAVFATLRHIRQDSVDLDAAIAAAFPGAVLHVPPPAEQASFSMTFPDMPKRQFGPHELSDGTLHFLALAGALLSYRLPPFIALNEPETSLHPDLLPALGGLIAKAAERAQIWVVTHSRPLAHILAQQTGVLPRHVIRNEDGTWLEGLGRLGLFADE